MQAAPPGAGDGAAARAAASAPDVQRTLGRFFATKGAPPGADTRAVAPITAKVTEQTVAVNHLNPAFVAGQSAEVSRFAFFATQADAADGQTASIWTTRSRTGGWQVSNIASGNDERGSAARRRVRRLGHGPVGRPVGRTPAPPPHLPDLSGTLVTGRPAREAGRSVPFQRLTSGPEPVERRTTSSGWNISSMCPL
ncbi:hypothetical protein OG884_06810 [Streptosporangium sp. NBC_01755]|uniref:hypothetical protein n=1 Tax=unclassified Streptosporangium TaxID=2632669 RepID=UPI002DD9A031|nr:MULTISPECIES: hypothetical protein [unclassified Streptosporangium]WSA26943.1 hypothetical protein OIE13_03335 [Streptosporangium sp. NBC_01810]WSD01632.1 hypothetical protein OG884_06810 [Streptosporangium sp. NBC_01755]